LISGDFNLDTKSDYLHILNKEYIELWLSSRSSKEHQKIAEYTLSSLTESDKKSIFSLLGMGAVAGDAELNISNFPRAWPGHGIIQDINGDGYLDYAEATAWENGHLDLGVYLGDKHGNIVDTAAFNLPGILFKEIENAVYKVGFLKDIDNDGIVDYAQAVSSEDGYENLDVYLGTSTGFVKIGKMPKNAFEQGKNDLVREGFLQDFNEDGRTDIVNIIGEAGHKRLDIYLSADSGFTKREINVHERKLTETQMTLEAWIKEGIFGSYIIDTNALVDSMNIFPDEKNKKMYSFLFPKQKLDEKIEKLKHLSEQRERFLNEKQQLFEKLEQEINNIYKSMDAIPEQYAINAATELPSPLLECMWRVAPPYKSIYCEAQVKSKLAKLEKKAQAKASEIRREKDSFSEQLKAFNNDELKLKKQLEIYKQFSTDTLEEETSQEIMPPPDFGKDDEYAS
jgi:hypothetical protein